MDDFSWALSVVKMGNKVYRQSWAKPDVFMAMANTPSNFLYIGSTDYISDQSDRPRVVVPWTPSQEDLFANDWKKFESMAIEVVERDHWMLTCFRFCMKWEGGDIYTNDPRDPGGATKYGVALNYNKDVIPDKNKDGKIDASDVKLIDEDDALRIYEKKYWLPAKCDKLPKPLAFVYADMVYNIGPGRSPKLLQESLNKLGNKLGVDGIIGPKTIAAAEKADITKAVKQLTADRLAYYKTRSGWSTYGKGWTNRTNDCEKEALKWIGKV